MPNKINAIYSNYHRRRSYQIRTLIEEKSSGSNLSTSVRKIACSSFSQPHLKTISQNYHHFRVLFPQVAQPQLLSQNNSEIVFEYLNASPLTQIIEENLLQKQFSTIFPLFDLFLSTLKDQEKISINPYQNHQFVQIFDPKSKLKKDFSLSALKFAPIDLIFANFLLDQASQKTYIIDQEWLYNFPLPLDFLIFRSLYDLCSRLQSTIQNFCSSQFPCYQLSANFLVPQEWFDCLYFSPDEIPLFYFWEQNFQNFINLRSQNLPPLLLSHQIFPLLTKPPQPLSQPLYTELLHQHRHLQNDYQQLLNDHQNLLAASKKLQSPLIKLILRPHYYLIRFFNQEKNFYRENGLPGYQIRIKNRLARRSFLKKLKSYQNHQFPAQNQSLLSSPTSSRPPSSSPSSPPSSPPSSSLSPASLSSLKILIIAGAPRTVSHIHRVDHLEEKLSLLRHSFLTIPAPQLALFPNPVQLLQNFDLLYIHRAVSDPNLEALVQGFRQQNKPILFDIDDLVFDPDLLPTIAQTQSLSSEQIQVYHQTMLKHQVLMKQSTALVAPTAYLCQYLQDFFQLPVHQLPNHLDQTSFNQGLTISQIPASPSALSSAHPLILGYFPGTKTHDQDFLTVAPALVYLFRHFPPHQIQLKIVGHLDLPPLIKPFLQTGHLTHHPAVPYSQLISQYQGVSLNLAPLQSASDPFCASKSELKYFFAGITGIPTLATPTPPYIEVSQSQGGLLLCQTPQDWLSTLLDFLNHPEKLHSLAVQARQHTKSTYSPDYQAAAYLQPLLQNYSSRP